MGHIFVAMADHFNQLVQLIIVLLFFGHQPLQQGFFRLIGRLVQLVLIQLDRLDRKSVV